MGPQGLLVHLLWECPRSWKCPAQAVATAMGSGLEVLLKSLHGTSTWLQSPPHSPENHQTTAARLPVGSGIGRFGVPTMVRLPGGVWGCWYQLPLLWGEDGVTTHSSHWCWWFPVNTGFFWQKGCVTFPAAMPAPSWC